MMVSAVTEIQEQLSPKTTSLKDPNEREATLTPGIDQSFSMMRNGKFMVHLSSKHRVRSANRNFNISADISHVVANSEDTLMGISSPDATIRPDR